MKIKKIEQGTVDRAKLARLEYHALARADVQHDDERRWTLFGAFLVAETLLTTMIGKGQDGVVAGLGMMSTALIGLAIWRNNLYLRDRSILASSIEGRIGPRAPELRFYDAHSQVPEERLKLQKGYGIFRGLQGRIARNAARWLHAWAVMRLALAASFLAWLGVLLTYRGVSPISAFWICIGLGVPVIIDWIWEMVQRAFDREGLEDERTTKAWVLTKVFGVGKNAGR